MMDEMNLNFENAMEDLNAMQDIDSITYYDRENPATSISFEDLGHGLYSYTAITDNGECNSGLVDENSSSSSSDVQLINSFFSDHLNGHVISDQDPDYKEWEDHIGDKEADTSSEEVSIPDIQDGAAVDENDKITVEQTSTEEASFEENGSVSDKIVEQLTEILPKGYVPVEYREGYQGEGGYDAKPMDFTECKSQYPEMGTILGIDTTTMDHTSVIQLDYKDIAEFCKEPGSIDGNDDLYDEHLGENNINPDSIIAVIDYGLSVHIDGEDVHALNLVTVQFKCEGDDTVYRSSCFADDLGNIRAQASCQPNNISLLRLESGEHFNALDRTDGSNREHFTNPNHFVAGPEEKSRDLISDSERGNKVSEFKDQIAERIPDLIVEFNDNAISDLLDRKDQMSNNISLLSQDQSSLAGVEHTLGLYRSYADARITNAETVFETSAYQFSNAYEALYYPTETISSGSEQYKELSNNYQDAKTELYQTYNDYAQVYFDTKPDELAAEYIGARDHSNQGDLDYLVISFRQYFGDEDTKGIVDSLRGNEQSEYELCSNLIHAVTDDQNIFLGDFKFDSAFIQEPAYQYAADQLKDLVASYNTDKADYQKIYIDDSSVSQKLYTYSGIEIVPRPDMNGEDFSERYNPNMDKEGSNPKGNFEKWAAGSAIDGGDSRLDVANAFYKEGICQGVNKNDFEQDVISNPPDQIFKDKTGAITGEVKAEILTGKLLIDQNIKDQTPVDIETVSQDAHENPKQDIENENRIEENEPDDVDASNHDKNENIGNGGGRAGVFTNGSVDVLKDVEISDSKLTSLYKDSEKESKRTGESVDKIYERKQEEITKKLEEVKGKICDEKDKLSSKDIPKRFESQHTGVQYSKMRFDSLVKEYQTLGGKVGADSFVTHGVSNLASFSNVLALLNTNILETAIIELLFNTKDSAYDDSLKIEAKPHITDPGGGGGGGKGGDFMEKNQDEFDQPTAKEQNTTETKDSRDQTEKPIIESEQNVELHNQEMDMDHGVSDNAVRDPETAAEYENDVDSMRSDDQIDESDRETTYDEEDFDLETAGKYEEPSDTETTDEQGNDFDPETAEDQIDKFDLEDMDVYEDYSDFNTDEEENLDIYDPETIDRNEENSQPETADGNEEDHDPEIVDKNEEDHDPETADKNKEDSDPETTDRNEEDLDPETVNKNEEDYDPETNDKNEKDSDPETVKELEDAAYQETSDEKEEDLDLIENDTSDDTSNDAKNPDYGETEKSGSLTIDENKDKPFDDTNEKLAGPVFEENKDEMAASDNEKEFHTVGNDTSIENGESLKSSDSGVIHQSENTADDTSGTPGQFVEPVTKESEALQTHPMETETKIDAAVGSEQLANRNTAADEIVSKDDGAVLSSDVKEEFSQRISESIKGEEPINEVLNDFVDSLPDTADSMAEIMNDLVDIFNDAISDYGFTDQDLMSDTAEDVLAEIVNMSDTVSDEVMNVREMLVEDGLSESMIDQLLSDTIDRFDGLIMAEPDPVESLGDLLVTADGDMFDAVTGNLADENQYLQYHDFSDVETNHDDNAHVMDFAEQALNMSADQFLDMINTAADLMSNAVDQASEYTSVDISEETVADTFDNFYNELSAEMDGNDFTQYISTDVLEQPASYDVSTPEMETYYNELTDNLAENLIDATIQDTGSMDDTLTEAANQHMQDMNTNIDVNNYDFNDTYQSNDVFTDNQGDVLDTADAIIDAADYSQFEQPQTFDFQTSESPNDPSQYVSTHPDADVPVDDDYWDIVGL